VADSTVPTHRKIIEGIQAVAIWCLCAGLFLWGIGYGLYCLTYDPGFATEGECDRALSWYQWKAGHHGETCEELENGHWKIFDVDGNAF
jgi:hypothetical protein